jgi:hypothetical protein
MGIELEPFASLPIMPELSMQASLYPSGVSGFDAVQQFQPVRVAGLELTEPPHHIAGNADFDKPEISRPIPDQIDHAAGRERTARS